MTGSVTREVVAVAGNIRDSRVELLVWFDATREPEAVLCRRWPGAWPPLVGDLLTSWRGTAVKAWRRETASPETTECCNS